MRPFTLPTLLVDTREQTPLDFSIYKERFQHVCPASLPFGDYQVMSPGLDRSIVFERKSLNDLVGTLTTGRERFIRELEKLADCEYAAIIIEASYGAVLGPYKYSKMPSHKIIGQLQMYQVRFDIDVIFAGSRQHSTEIIMRKIGQFYGQR